MNHHVPFARMNGAGNEILVVDMRSQSACISQQAITYLANQPDTRSDQIMAIHDPRIKNTDAYIMIFNRDGSNAQACGNGMRCVVHALAAESDRKHFSFQTRAGILTAQEHEKNLIAVDMGEPVFEWDKIPLAEEFADTRKIELQIGPINEPILHSPSAISMGNPHAVFWVDKDVFSYDLERFGPLLENHPVFPQRANISIAEVLNKNEINMRTWERGAGLTKACGSAACAGVVCAHRTRRTDNKVVVHMPGGDLSLVWQDNNHVIMTGPVEWEWSGMINHQSGEWSRNR